MASECSATKQVLGLMGWGEKGSRGASPTLPIARVIGRPTITQNWKAHTNLAAEVARTQLVQQRSVRRPQTSNWAETKHLPPELVEVAASASCRKVRDPCDTKGTP